jgi:hypothetical protein
VVGVRELDVGESTLPVRELAILRVGFQCRCAYEWGHHVPIARRCARGDAEIARVARGPDPPGWSRADAAILRAIDELLADQMIGDTPRAELAVSLDPAGRPDTLPPRRRGSAPRPPPQAAPRSPCAGRAARMRRSPRSLRSRSSAARCAVARPLGHGYSRSHGEASSPSAPTGVSRFLFHRCGCIPFLIDSKSRTSADVW